MSKMRPATAKILFGSEGLGTPSVDMVRRRAEEIALIQGHAEYTEADWQQAKWEIHGSHQADDEHSEEMGAAALVSGHDMVATNSGHHTARLPMEDDGNVVEELYREGMDEAQHERMLEAIRSARDEEDEEPA